MPIELRNHSQPCEHFTIPHGDLVDQGPEGMHSVWKCDVTGCPGGREIVIDYEAVAKAIYKDYEDCTDSYVEKVWAWESESDELAREPFQATVQEFTTTAHHAIEAALGIGGTDDH